MKSRPLVTFTAVTFGFSWTLWVLMILSARGMLPLRFPTSFLGSFGPLVGALAAARLSCEAGALRGIRRSLLAWRVPPVWYGLSVLAFSLLFTWVYNRTGGSLLVAVLLHAGINTPSFLAPAVAPALAAGPLYGWLVAGLFAALALGVVGATRGALGRTSAGRA